MKEGYVRVSCDRCGTEFERFQFHPYLTMCPKCRKVAAKERKMARKHSVKCASCRNIIEKESPKLGMHICPVKSCSRHWWSMGDRLSGIWIDKTSMEDNVYEMGELIGPFLTVYPKLKSAQK